MAMMFPTQSDSTVTPRTLNLGEHSLTINPDHTVEIADQQVAMQLTSDEAYKLLVTLQTMFS